MLTTESQIPCRLLPAGLGEIRRARDRRQAIVAGSRLRQAIIPAGRLRPGRALLSIGCSAIVLQRGDRTLLQVPHRILSAVRFHPIPVDAQLLDRFRGSLRVAAWTGVFMAAYQLCYLLTLVFEPRATLPLITGYVIPRLLYSVWFMTMAGFFVHLLVRCLPGILRIEGRIWQVRFEIVGGHRFALSMDRRQMMRCVPPLCRTGKVVYQERRRDTLLERGWVYRERFGAWLRQTIGEIF